MNEATATQTPAQIAAALSPRRRRILLRGARLPSRTEIAWAREMEAAGLLEADDSGGWKKTDLGRAVAAILEASNA